MPEKRTARADDCCHAIVSDARGLPNIQIFALLGPSSHSQNDTRIETATVGRLSSARETWIRTRRESDAWVQIGSVQTTRRSTFPPLIRLSRARSGQQRRRGRHRVRRARALRNAVLPPPSQSQPTTASLTAIQGEARPSQLFSVFEQSHTGQRRRRRWRRGRRQLRP